MNCEDVEIALELPWPVPGMRSMSSFEVQVLQARMTNAHRSLVKALGLIIDDNTNHKAGHHKCPPRAVR